MRSLFSTDQDFSALKDFRFAVVQLDTAHTAVAVAERMLHPWITVAGVLMTKKVITQGDLNQWLLLPPGVVQKLLYTPSPRLALPADRDLAWRLLTMNPPTLSDLQAVRTILTDFAYVWHHVTEAQQAAYEYLDAFLTVHHRIPDRYIARAIGKTQNYVLAHRRRLGIAA